MCLERTGAVGRVERPSLCVVNVLRRHRTIRLLTARAGWYVARSRVMREIGVVVALELFHDRLALRWLHVLFS